MKTFRMHCFICSATVFLCLIYHSAAIIDMNSNGMSDLWEKKYNNGALFPATFLPTSDSDQDGWDNAAESIAGTNPHSKNPPDGFIVTELTFSQADGVFTISWPTIIGKRYRLQGSYDMSSWVNVGDWFTATASSHGMGINVMQPGGSMSPKLFWRVTFSDADVDNDELTNAEENELGSNPNVYDGDVFSLFSDVDGDGLTLFDERERGLAPLLADSDGDGVNDTQDAFPLDSSRSTLSSTTGDQTAPVVTIQSPASMAQQ